MSAVEFNYTKWAAMFPYLANGGVTQSVAESFFEVAEFLFANSACSPVKDPARRLMYFNYIVAHLARLAGYPVATSGTAAPTGMVGRVSSATEGTVSVSSEYGPLTASNAWWLQTPEGATFWQLTASLRTARYIPAPPRYFGPLRRLGGPWRP